jgi:cytochrome c-type biogenesis protein CcmH/NrfG
MFLQMEHWSTAADALSKAIELQPSHAQAHGLIAMAFDHLALTDGRSASETRRW